MSLGQLSLTMSSLLAFFFSKIERYILCGAKFSWNMIFGGFRGFSRDL